MKRPAIFLLDSRKFLIVYIIEAVKNAGCRHFSGCEPHSDEEGKKCLKKLL